MSDTLDSRLIVALLNSERGSSIVENGITVDMFESDARPVFHMINSHFSQYNKLPSKKEVLRHYQGFVLKKATEPLEYYCQELQRRYKFKQFKEIIGNAVDVLSTTEDQNIDSVLSDTAAKTGMIMNCGVTKAKDYRDRVEEIKANLAHKKLQAAEFSFGFPALDKDLIGMDRGNLTLLAGSPGAGKTWLLLQMAYNIWLTGKSILIISLEMPTKIIEDRLDAIICKLDYNRYRRGQLTTQEEAELYEATKRMKAAKNFFHLISFENYDSKAKTQLGSVESIRSCIQRYNPEFLFVDGVYLGMSMEWEKATKFANDFHAMLVGCMIPCAATTQMKQEADPSKPKLKDLAFTAGFQHAASYVLMLGKDSEGDGGELTMYVAKAREASDHTSYFVEFKPATKIEVVPMIADKRSLLFDEDEVDAQMLREGGVDGSEG